MPKDASTFETKQNKDVSGSSTINFQHSEEGIIRGKSETQALDACKLYMVVDLADILSDIKLPKKLGYNDIYQFQKNHFIPTKNDQLSHSLVTKKCSTYKLCLRINWLDDNPWIVYKNELESGLCKACILFNPVEDNVNRGTFVKRAFRDFSKPEKIREHAQTQYHNDAILRAQELVKIYENPITHVSQDLDKQKRLDLNVHILKLIIKAVNLCSKQGLPVRGHCDNSSDLFSRDGNFHTVVKILADMGPILKDHLETGSKNAQMTSLKIQNDKIITKSVRTKV